MLIISMKLVAELMVRMELDIDTLVEAQPSQKASSLSPVTASSLPFLKWSGKNYTNANHRFRRPVTITTPSLTPNPSPNPTQQIRESVVCDSSLIFGNHNFIFVRISSDSPICSHRPVSGTQQGHCEEYLQWR